MGFESGLADGGFPGEETTELSEHPTATPPLQLEPLGVADSPVGLFLILPQLSQKCIDPENLFGSLSPFGVFLPHLYA